MKPIIYRVAVFIPVDKVFEYLAPMDYLGIIPIGSRVNVSFGYQDKCGLVIDHVKESEYCVDKLKNILSVLDAEPLFDSFSLSFLNWASNYYFHALGEVISTAIPPRLRRANAISTALPSIVKLTPVGLNTDINYFLRAPKQRLIFLALKEHLGGIERTLLNKEFGSCSTVLHALEKKGFIGYSEKIVKSHVSRETSYRLNDDQLSAIAKISESEGKYKAFLLDGVTGSGKTDVYIGAINHYLTLNKQVLLLVPEIGLTPQLLKRLRKQVYQPIAILHSALTPVEKEKTWLSVSQGKIRVLIGTRSSIFTPLPDLGLIMVDEEHDVSYKQQDGFRYSARDLAVILANRHNCPIVLGSATPSIESLYNVEKKRYEKITLTKRAGKATIPSIDLIDLRHVEIKANLSPSLIKLIKQALERKEQVLLFINRRGYAPVMMCQACGWTAHCDDCNSPMTLHIQKGILWCHHCGSKHSINQYCPSCNNQNLIPLGKGTERIEEWLRYIFPNAGVVRIDRDSTRKKGSLDNILKAVNDRKYDIMVGTQMLAKGHDFTGVTLAALLDIDQGLFSLDYRAGERLAQLLIQVAGRAGRAEKKGRVVIQTFYPEHPLLQTLIQQSYEVFAHNALQERKEANLPPVSYQALIRAYSDDPLKTYSMLEKAVECGKKTDIKDVDMWGPFPAPKEKREGQFRAHLLFQSNNRKILHIFIRKWKKLLEKEKIPSKVRWSIDIDPQDMM